MVGSFGGRIEYGIEDSVYSLGVLCTEYGVGVVVGDDVMATD